MCDFKEYAFFLLSLSVTVCCISIPCLVMVLLWIDVNETKRLSKNKETANV